MIVVLLVVNTNSNDARGENIRSGYVRGEVLVKTNKFSRGVMALEGALPGARIKESFGGGGVGVVQLPGGIEVLQAVKFYTSLPEVEYAEPNYIRYAQFIPNDPLYKSQWGLDEIGMPAVWDKITGSHNVVVAVIDTGIDITHPELSSNIFMNDEDPVDGVDNDGNGYPDDYMGWDFIGADNDPSDDNGHGTHVAGIIGAMGNNGTGVAGINWNIRLMPLKILDSDGYGTVADEIRAIDYAIQNGARLINASFGGSNFFSQFEKDAIQAALNAGVLFITASGNGGLDSIGDDNDIMPFYPASYNLSNIISVSAINQSGSLASYSNYGQTSVDLGAPGSGIISTYPGTYKTLSGTSMATAFVTGAVAMMYSYFGDVSSSTVKDILLNTVTPETSLETTTVSGGVLNLERAIGVVSKPTGITVLEEKEESVKFTWNDNATSEQGYRIMRATSGGFSVVSELPPDTVFFEDTGLVDGSLYRYKVVAYFDGLEGESSDEITVLTVLSAPTELRGSLQADGSVHLSWVDNSRAEDGYIIERRVSGASSFAETGRVGTGVTEFVDTGVQDEVEYHYRVRAYNGTFGNSDPSGEVVVMTASSGNVGSAGGGGGGGCSVMVHHEGDDGSIVLLLSVFLFINVAKWMMRR